MDTSHTKNPTQLTKHTTLATMCAYGAYVFQRHHWWTLVDIYSSATFPDILSHYSFGRGVHGAEIGLPSLCLGLFCVSVAFVLGADQGWAPQKFHPQ